MKKDGKTTTDGDASIEIKSLNVYFVEQLSDAFLPALLLLHQGKL